MKKSYSYRRGLLRGWDHARLATDTCDYMPTAEDVAKIGVPSDLDPDEYREGYWDGIERHNAGKRSPNVKILP
jgi:hypothetical protein